MREIGAAEAKTHLLSLLDEVEDGTTFVITRRGRPIARLAPEAEHRRAATRSALERLATFRKTMPRLTREEILSARHEGHKY